MYKYALFCIFSFYSSLINGWGLVVKIPAKLWAERASEPMANLWSKTDTSSEQIDLTPAILGEIGSLLLWGPDARAWQITQLEFIILALLICCAAHWHYCSLLLASIHFILYLLFGCLPFLFFIPCSFSLFLDLSLLWVDIKIDLSEAGDSLELWPHVYYHVPHSYFNLGDRKRNNNVDVL